MKNIFLAVAFAVATLTGCAHKTTVVKTDTKVVKAPCCKKSKAAPKAKASPAPAAEKKAQ